MNFSRNFQLGAMVVIVATLAGIYLNTRGQSEITDDDSHFGIVTTAPTGSTPASTAQPLVAAPPLPKSKADIIAALSARGYKLESFAPSQPIANVDGYRVAGIPAAVAFTERNGQLTMVDVATTHAGPRTNGPLLLDFAEIVGEVATGRSRDTTRQAIAQTMAALGKEPRRMSCSFGAGKERFRLQLTRHGDSGYSFAFTAESAKQPPRH